MVRNVSPQGEGGLYGKFFGRFCGAMAFVVGGVEDIFPMTNGWRTDDGKRPQRRTYVLGLPYHSDSKLFTDLLTLSLRLFMDSLTLPLLLLGGLQDLCR